MASVLLSEDSPSAPGVIGEAVGEAVGSEVIGEAVGEAVGSEVIGEMLGETVGPGVIGEAVLATAHGHGSLWTAPGRHRAKSKLSAPENMLAMLVPLLTCQLERSLQKL